MMDLNWASLIESKNKEAVDMPSMKIIMKGLNELMYAGNMELLGDLIRNNIKPDTHKQMVVILFRTTCSLKQEIPHWHNSLIQAAAYLECQGLKSESILSGLLPKRS